jgi:DNA-binding transcriptional regulator YiaG
MITVEEMKTIRKTRGWSQHKLASVLDVSQPTIVRWEKTPPQSGPAAMFLRHLIEKNPKGEEDGNGTDRRQDSPARERTAAD